jgi:hypothetical protein
MEGVIVVDDCRGKPCAHFVTLTETLEIEETHQEDDIIRENKCHYIAQILYLTSYEDKIDYIMSRRKHLFRIKICVLKSDQLSFKSAVSVFILLIDNRY